MLSKSKQDCDITIKGLGIRSVANRHSNGLSLFRLVIGLFALNPLFVIWAIIFYPVEVNAAVLSLAAGVNPSHPYRFFEARSRKLDKPQPDFQAIHLSSDNHSEDDSQALALPVVGMNGLMGLSVSAWTSNLRVTRSDAHVSSILALMADFILRPHDADIYINLSYEFARLRRFDTALEILDRFHQVNGYSAQIAIHEIGILMMTGDLSAAREKILALLSREPNNVFARLYWGDILFIKGDLGGALESYTAAHQVIGLSEDIVARLGSLSMTRQDYTLAVQYYQYWASQSPDDPLPRYCLGLALTGQGDRDEAQASLQHSADLYLARHSPNSQARSRILESIRQGDLMDCYIFSYEMSD